MWTAFFTALFNWLFGKRTEPDTIGEIDHATIEDIKKSDAARDAANRVNADPSRLREHDDNERTD